MIKIPNIILLNDWEPKKFLRIIIAIHLAMFGAFGLDYIDLEIPILRQVIGFVYLTFVPGIILLRLLKIHRMGNAETVLLSTGLSISFLMFGGYFLNTILSFLKIDSSLSFSKVIIFITTFIFLLGILSYKIDKFYPDKLPYFKISRSTIFLTLVPVLSLFGTYLVNFQKNNIVLMILIVSIALILVLVVFNKIHSEQYPLAIFIIALSLLFGYSLISTYLTGWDINQEYYVHKQVLNAAFWNSEITSNLNAMLSIVILPAIYSYFLKIDGAWVFKIVYPIIFSLVPVGLYCIYQRQVNSDKISFLSVFFFMSFITFFTEMLSLARQEIAEFFFVMLIFLTVDETLNKNIRNILLIIFGVSLVTSHYGLSYIYMIFIIFIFLFSIDLVRTSKIRHLNLPDFNLKKSTLYYFVIFYIVFAIFWYINISNSSVFSSVIYIGDHIYNTILIDFFNPMSRNSETLMAIGLADPRFFSLGREIHRALQFLTQIFIIVGFLRIVIYREYTTIKAEFFYLIVACLGLLFISIVVPNFASSLNITRVYHIALFALSPLFVIGGIFILKKSTEFININNKKEIFCIILILGVMVPYFLFNTGFVYEMTNDVPNSLFLGAERMRNDNNTKVGFYSQYIQEQDVYSARWYYKNKDVNRRVFADSDSQGKVLLSYGMLDSVTPLSVTSFRNIENTNNLYNKYYLYLRKLNVCDDIIVVRFGEEGNKSIISPLINDSSNVYSNGCGLIYEK